MDLDFIRKANALKGQTILGGFTNTQASLEKGKKAAIGEIREHGDKKVKKIAEGKWVEISEHGHTKAEHEEAAKRNSAKSKSALNDDRDEDHRHYNDNAFKHEKSAKKLSDKEYSDDEVHGKDNNSKQKASMSEEHKAAAEAYMKRVEAEKNNQKEPSKPEKKEHQEDVVHEKEEEKKESFKQGDKVIYYMHTSRTGPLKKFTATFISNIKDKEGWMKVKNKDGSVENIHRSWM